VVGYSGREFKYSSYHIKAVTSGGGDRFALEWTKAGTKTGWVLRNLTSTGIDVYLSSSSVINQYGNHGDRLLNILAIPDSISISGQYVVGADSVKFGDLLSNGGETSRTASLAVRPYSLSDVLEYSLTGDPAFTVTAGTWSAARGGTLNVAFTPPTPTATTAYNATLTIKSAGNGGPTLAVKLTGTFVQMYSFAASLATDPVLGTMTQSKANGSYAQGTLITLTAAVPANATPETDSTRFVGWKNAAGVVSTEDTIHLTLTQDTALTANFELKPKHTVTVLASEAFGSVTGSGLYFEGFTATLTATPADSALFVNWTDAANNIVGTNSQLTITVSSNTTLTAHFKLKPKYRVTAIADDDALGSVTGGGSYFDGFTATLVATPKSGIWFVNWTYSGEVVSASSDATFTFAVSRDTTLVAHFSNTKPSKVEAAPNNPSYGHVTGGGAYTNGAIITLTATPVDSARFVNWTDAADNVVSTDNPLTITVGSDTTLTANFKLKPKHTVTVSANNDSWGSVTGGGEYFDGFTATLTATPVNSALFVNWTNAADNIMGTDKILTITVRGSNTLIAHFVPKSSDATLSSLTVSEGELSPTFSPATLSYTVSVGSTIDSIALTAVPANANATLTGGGNPALQEGDNTFSIVVTAEDGVTTQTYTVTVVKAAPGSDATLSSLTVSAGELSPTFSSGIFEYAVSVGSTIDSIALTAAPADAKATLTGDGSHALQEGNNIFSIVVTAEDGVTTQTYTVRVVKAAPGSDATLSSLTVSAGELSPAFSPATLSYAVSVGSTIDSITLTAAPANANATLTGGGAHALTADTTVVSVVVQADVGVTTDT
jgi:hypothetical protein